MNSHGLFKEKEFCLETDYNLVLRKNNANTFYDYKYPFHKLISLGG
jgi:hypothetical protein